MSMTAAQISAQMKADLKNAYENDIATINGNYDITVNDAKAVESTGKSNANIARTLEDAKLSAAYQTAINNAKQTKDSLTVQRKVKYNSALAALA
jgi:hypothetical protein